MLPYKLTLQAFGAYPERVEIPFYKLNSSNVYLITGVTGSGKTTIFDAICFALFNSSSTSLRGNSTLRSHYAKDETVSFVEFEFLFNGEKYKVKRTPSFYRKKIRGEGLILENQKAQIQLPDNKLIIGVKETDEFIVNLLGLNINQFSQIALLAQGEFLKLLNSDTQTRGEIFRNIFKTDNFLTFQNSLKDKAQNLKQDFELIKNAILQCVSMLNYDDNEINELKKYYADNSILTKFDDFINLINSKNLSDKNEISKIEDEISKIDLKNTSIQNELLKINDKINLIKNFDEITLKANLKENELLSIKKEFDLIPNYQLELDNLKLQFEKLKTDYIKANEIIQAKNELDKIINSNKNLINKDNEFKNNLFNEKKNHLIFEYQNYINLKNDLKILEEDFNSFKEQTLELSKKYEFTYCNYLSNIAGILALNLKDDEMCPVCGSKVHPKIAELNDKNISKELVENLKKELDNSNELLSLKARECSILNEKINSKLNEFNLLKEHYKINSDDIDIAFSVSKSNFEENIKTIEDNILALNNEIEASKNNILSFETKISTLEKDLKNSNPDDILNEYKELELKINNLQNKINSVRKTFEDNNNSLLDLNAQIKLLKSQIDNMKDIDEKKNDLIQNEIIEVSDLKKNKTLELKELNSKFDSNNKLLSEIKEKYFKYNEIEKTYIDYKTLSDCANGNLKGKNKIAFEQYIQGYYLDMVLVYANKILKTMTKNQFMLLRKKESSSLSNKTGLDLEVMDFYTYKTRDTKTLSGGESFKAALSLALGLSQTISFASGAINIDAMFIDEGFGSLDNESLELAMDVIMNLSDSGHLVGVISHVEELKTKIPNQIISIKTPEGSKIELTF